MIDREQIENWEGGPGGETLEELFAPISAKKMPARAVYARGHQPLTDAEARDHQRKRELQSATMKAKHYKAVKTVT